MPNCNVTLRECAQPERERASETEGGREGGREREREIAFVQAAFAVGADVAYRSHVGFSAW